MCVVHEGQSAGRRRGGSQLSQGWQGRTVELGTYERWALGVNMSPKEQSARRSSE
jgi:hypothetical protein